MSTHGKPILFPSAVQALGGTLASGLTTCVWWSPYHPFKSSLAGYGAKALCDVWAEKITSIAAETICQTSREFIDHAMIGATIVIDGFRFPFRPAQIAGSGRGAVSHKGGMHEVTAARASVRRLVKDDLSSAFWGGVVVLGLLIPFLIEVFLADRVFATVMACLSGLLGGFYVRVVVVTGAIKAPLNAEGVLVPLSPRPE